MTGLGPDALRVTMVLNSLLAGGAERVAVALLGELARREHDVTLVTLAGHDSDVFAAPKSVHRVALDQVGDSSGPLDALRRNARRVLALRRAVTASAPDVVVSFQTTVNVTTLAALAGTGLPVVISERVDPRVHQLPRAWSALRRGLYPWAVALVVQTESLRGWGTRVVRRRRVEVIPNPVAETAQRTARTPNAAVGRHRLIAVGRLERQKGYDLLLDAFARGAGAAPSWDLVVIGEGSCRVELERQAHRLGLDGRVTFPGFSSDVPASLSEADAYVLSSRYEGFPNALLEAMAHGLPVVAADCPSGPGEIIEDGLNGLLATCGSVEHLAAQLTRLLTDVDLRSRLGVAALEVHVAYALEAVVDRWEDLLSSVAR